MTSADADAGVIGRPGWPCQSCGESVPLEMTECVKCGSGFMAAAKSTVRVSLPVLGEVTSLSTGGRFALMIGGAIIVGAILFGLLILLAAIF